MLFLYGYYKQATVGDNDQAAPGFLDFKGKSKHTAFKNIINPDSFRRELGKRCGEQPDQEILDLLTRIYNDNSVTNIRDWWLYIIYIYHI